MNYEDLQKKSDVATANYNALSVQIKELESQMTANGELQKQIVIMPKHEQSMWNTGKPAETFLKEIVTPDTGDW